MDRTDGQNYIDIGGGRRGFRDQNVDAGVPGTRVTAAFLNSLQEEILTAIENAGITPAAADWSQLDAAIRKVAAKTVNDYIIPLAQLNALPWLPVISLTQKKPPAKPALGDLYVVPDGGTGEWSDKGGQIAEWNGQKWLFSNSRDGHGIGLPDGQVYQKVGGNYVKQIALDVQSGRWTLARDIGSENAIKCNLDPEPAKIDDGLLLVLVPANDATSSEITIQVNNFQPKKLVNPDGTLLPSKAITKNVPAIIVYNKKIDAFSIFTSEKQGGSTISFAARGMSSMNLADRVSYPLIVGTAEVSDNTGGGYNVKNGEFTVPEDGLYIVTGNAPFPYSYAGNSFSSFITIEKNAFAIAENSMYCSGRVLCVAVICRMKKGDVIRLVQKIEGANGSVGANQFAANFSAARLGK
ncbi:DUF2793 domain-containing protein [Bartonella apis]|uniref:DUF2793 domain-containing protein n=1 Tax=Bartonella apis TaxID=1686310 RepID=UPI002430EC03|nr:DUF2793 domain-containing protein [Bartonella apis]